VNVTTLTKEEEAKEEQVGGRSPRNQTSQSTERKPSKNIASMLGQANKLLIMRLHQNTSSNISRRHLTEETMSPKHIEHWLKQIPTHGK